MNRESVITENLGLVHACCRKFAGRGIDYDDLFQAGSVGLVKAVDRFDENMGNRLSTYAVPVILGEIKRLFRDGGAVKVSRSVKELALRVGKTSEILSAKLGREPTISEIADYLEAPREAVAEAVCAAKPTLSLTFESDGDEVQLDLPSESYDETVTDKIAVEQLLNRLDNRDRELVNCRFFKKMTQQKTAELLGMTQVQVSRSEKRILLLLRGMLK